MIPKIIHLCWLGGDPYPPKIQSCIDSWKKYLPEYEIMLWDAKRFDLNSLAWTKQAFEAKKYAFVVDYLRFYAVYNYGGIYFDSDVEVIKSFDELLHLPYFVGKEAVPQSMELSAFGAEKGTVWVKDAMDYYKDRPFIKEDGEMDMTPLPFVMWPHLSKLYDCSFIESPSEFDDDASKICILPGDWFNARLYIEGKRHLYNITDNTHSIHHYANSWTEDEYPGGFLHKLYYKITGKDWRYGDNRFRLYGQTPGKKK
ncbi:MAG: glycosyl transferase [Bacteroidales bacterium]|nr:glycosyl transferase [Bacteroidales bacterium]